MPEVRQEAEEKATAKAAQVKGQRASDSSICRYTQLGVAREKVVSTILVSGTDPWRFELTSAVAFDFRFQDFGAAKLILKLKKCFSAFDNLDLRGFRDPSPHRATHDIRGSSGPSTKPVRNPKWNSSYV